MSVPASYDQLRTHLELISSNPSTNLDIRLVEKLQAELVAISDPQILAAILVQIADVFATLQNDPTPLTNLGIKAATYLSFSQIQAIEPPVSLIAGIRAPSPPINLLSLFLLRKASESASDAAVIAGNPALLTTLVEAWLTTSSTAVAEAALDVLWSLLEVDNPNSIQGNDESDKTKAAGQGLVWRRLFGDSTVYKLLFSICSFDTAGQSGQPKKREKSVAQGRFLDFVTRLGTLSWTTLTTSHFPDIELKFKSKHLLEFAACRMVDTDDVLLHMTLIHFFCELLKINAPGIKQSCDAAQKSHPKFSSPSLEFLISSGLHCRTMNSYINPSILNPAEAPYLSGPIMSYVSLYAQLYPNHLLQNPQPFLDGILTGIHRSLDIPSAQWAHGTVPSGDLNILASLPRVMILEAGKRSLNPLLTVPSKPLHKNTLDALGRIFSGPSPTPSIDSEQQIVLNGPLTSAHAEAAAARTLYFQYLNEHTDIWANVVAAAETVAMTDTALAAIAFITSVATANWASNPSSNQLGTSFAIPTEDEIEQLGPSPAGNLPRHGSWALLVPPALTVVLPYLFKDPQTYANFVAGGRGDTESAVWRVATAKYDALVALESSIEKIGGDTSGFSDLMRSLKRRVSQGPWGNTSQVGSRVDALEL
ncbi:hypothetical protein LOZ12_002169 [Ophidiomyces ophidiicola]|uniref:Uncharacterized protein n=1 Tax=Ophidiomyces ophidiicola TaxID=1387563 RepID=A0ACB8UYE6_9EURO|nr:hypothetical protein LOZ64_001387 [Ophidiomyces ophidiicola]KAI1949340.1 hypothetical protein LOZ62_002304 [Ophidiomyces ophidiicola]KAI1970950.1 hypothetical protein LOZ56_003362 [Ophidiomyces ophidiicola]KAI2005989.1 hypothetical protein LOZ50_003380 [Ophidiomyces ophidiicola]KAI2030729.1 hypothetical protein LOZ45_001511 [Ophidiomyces ophidiicola]